MDSTDKSIKFSVQVDQRSLTLTVSAIRQLTQEVKNLSDALARAGGGGGLLGGMSAKAGLPNTGTEGIMNAEKRPGMTGGMAGITQAITEDAKTMTAIAKAGNDAITSMTRTLKTSITDQVNTIKGLQRGWEELNKTYKGSGGAAAAGFGGGTGGSGGGGHGFGGFMGGGLGGTSSGRTTNSGVSGGGVPGGFMGGGLGGGLGGPPGSFMNGGLGGGGEGSGGGFGVLGQIGSGLWSFGKSALGMVGIPLAAGALVNYGLNQANEAGLAQAQYNMDIGMRSGRVGAGVGSALGGLGQSIRGGNVALNMAFEKEVGEALVRERGITKERQRMAEHAAGRDITLGSAAGRVGGVIGKVGENVIGNVTDTINVTKTKSEIDYENAIAMQPVKQAQDLAERAQNRTQSEWYKSTLTNEIAGMQWSNIAMARSGGLSLGLNKKGDNMALAEFEAAMIRAGYSGAEGAAAMGSGGRVLGRGLRGFGIKGMMAQAGGFDAMNEIMAMGAQYGSGKAGSQAMYDLFQHHGVGKGGIDVTAGSQIAATVAKMMGNGNFQGTGAGLAEAMLGAANTGGVGGDMYMARILPGGMAAYQRDLNGSGSGLQMGINAITAAKHFKNWYAQKAAMDMDAGTLINVLRGGEKEFAKTNLALHGGTLADLQGYVTDRNKFSLSQFIRKGGDPNSKVGIAVAGVQQAGGIIPYLKGLPKKEREAAINAIAAGRGDVKGGTVDENRGAIYAEIMADKELAAGIKRSHGAGGPKLTGAAKATADAAAAKRLEQGAGEAEGTKSGELPDAILTANKNARLLGEMTKDILTGSGDFNKALSAMTEEIIRNLGYLNPGAAKRLRDAKNADRIATDEQREERQYKPGPTVTIPKVRQ